MTISHARPGQLRPSGDDGGAIVRVGPDRLVEAVTRLIAGAEEGGPAAARRFIDYARRQQIALEAMWAGLDPRGRVRHTVLVVPNPGRTAMVFTSRLGASRDIAAVAALLEHACRESTSMDLDLVQTLLDPDELLSREAFGAAGFEVLATLSYLQRSVPRRRPVAPEWPEEIRVESFDETQTAALLAVLEASYEETLDCPGLRGRRRTADILAGHRASGEFDPALWTLLLEGDTPVGALLLNPCPAQQSIELVYLGLAPSARGRGLGARLLRHGMVLVAGRPEQTITLAVDEQNAPALSVYRREGFRPMLRRLALIRSLRRPGAPARTGH